MTRPELSIVVPIFNEAATLRELVRRCLVGATATGKSFELILVDDASTDETPRIAAALAIGAVRHERLPANRGQAGATRAGLALARGTTIVVLDGDLQDPPEAIPSLVSTLAAARRPEAVAFAVKRRRSDPLWFRAAATAYRLLQRVFAGARLPSGAGAFCAMSGEWARRIAATPAGAANLSTILVALGASPMAVAYDKAARVDGRSRVGVAGLAREAMGSLFLTRALERGVVAAALTAAGGALVLKKHSAHDAVALLTSALLLAVLAVSVRARRHSTLQADGPLGENANASLQHSEAPGS